MSGDFPDLFSLLERERKVTGSTVYIRFYPMIIKRMEGVYVWDVKDRRYLDFNASWAVANVGHSHPRVIEKVSDQLKKFISASYTTFPYVEAIEYVERIRGVSSVSEGKKAVFGHSGSDINDGVYKLLLLVTGRERMVSFIGAYHGQTLGSYSVSGHKAQAMLSPYKEVIKVPYPYCYRCLWGLRYPGCNLKCVKYIEYLLDTVYPGDTFAGVFVEPVQSDGGDVVPPPDFHRKLFQVIKKYDLAYVMDEVKVGFGRTGKFFASDTFGVKPDIITMGKPMASGFPLSMALMREDIADKYEGTHLFTLSPNPVSIAAAHATLDVILDNDLADNAASMGDYLLRSLKEVMANHDLIGDVRGKGLILGIELVMDRESKAPASAETAKAVYRMWELGLLTAYTGMHSNVIELTPPLIINREHVDEAVNLIDKAIDDVEHGRVPDEKVRMFAGW